ncbi:RHS repeat-associated core domain-containing protein [Clostridium felsineum]|uniref:RHS repeat-associated core domain-containing protein n=1 Tax=Clostridium felsineum TaxID=36839 RepID=UPI00098BD91F|nr:RHS repeat-associated core domain-containing protein [Clostridium felsineum]URZ04120.1 hypothetical protein CLAUR_042080 [Clostridium felsineum]
MLIKLCAFFYKIFVISIDGSLKDTVGKINPYRYRGYRYDNETGLYYLQSRYYNAEWGRFVNADIVAAVAGDVLSTNMYAYCKNDPVDMSDTNGERPAYVGESSADVEVSVLYTSRMLIGRSPTPTTSATGNKSKKSNLRGDIISSAETGAGPSAVDSGTASFLARMRNRDKMVRITQQPLPSGGVSPEFIAFKQTKPWLSAAKGFYKYLGGAATIGAWVYCMWDDFHNHKNNHSVRRALIDTAGVAAGIVAGAVLIPATAPFWVAAGLSAAIGLGIGMGTSYVKRRLYGD